MVIIGPERGVEFVDEGGGEGVEGGGTVERYLEWALAWIVEGKSSGRMCYSVQCLVEALRFG